MCQACTIFIQAEWIEMILNTLRSYCHSVDRALDPVVLRSKFVRTQSVASTPIPEFLNSGESFSSGSEILALTSVGRLLVHLTRLEEIVRNFVLEKIGGREAVQFIQELFSFKNRRYFEAQIERFLKEKLISRSLFKRKIERESQIGPITCQQIFSSFRFSYIRKKEIQAFTLNGQPAFFEAQRSKDKTQRQIGFLTQLIEMLHESLQVEPTFHASIQAQLLLRGDASSAEVPCLPLLQVLSDEIADRGNALVERAFFPRLFHQDPQLPQLKTNPEWSPAYEIVARVDGCFSVTRYRLYDFVSGDQKLGFVNMRWRVTGSLDSSSYLGALECEEFCLYPQEDASMKTGALLLKLYPLLGSDDS